jgi:hypothetical protein
MGISMKEILRMEVLMEEVAYEIIKMKETKL